MIFFPTRNRPHLLKRFIENYKKTGATLPVTLIIDMDNISIYLDAWNTAPEGWTLFPNKDVRNLRDALNNAFEAFPNEPFYGIVADDLIPMTKHWDVKLAKMCGTKYLSWPNDGIWGEQLPTHPFIGGDLARAWGWISPPYTNRHCADFIYKDIASACDLLRYCGEVTMKHQHWQLPGNEHLFDSTYALQPSAQEGHVQYHDVYRNSEQFKHDVARTKEKLGL